MCDIVAFGNRPSPPPPVDLRFTHMFVRKDRIENGRLRPLFAAGDNRPDVYVGYKIRNAGSGVHVDQGERNSGHDRRVGKSETRYV